MIAFETVISSGGDFNMSSISVGELKYILSKYPDDYEVVMEITTKHDIKAGSSIAFVNGIKPNNEFREIRLTN